MKLRWKTGCNAANHISEGVITMKQSKRAARFLIGLAAILLLTACTGNNTPAGPGGSPEASSAPSESAQSAKWFTDPRELASGDGYQSSEYYLLNEITGRHIYSVETKPTGLSEGEKVPVVVYVHGQSGYATNFSAIYTRLVKEKIAAFSFECCGGNRSGAKSEGSKLFPAHYTSRITDLETVLAKVKTLDYVDTDHIFLFGESYGGVTASLDIINHNEIPGLILLSTGISDTMLAREEDDPTYLPEYDYADPLEAIKGYKGDVICFNGQQDFAHDAGENQIAVYNQRDTGSAVFYSLENSDHSFSALSDDGKEFLIVTMKDFVLGHS